MQYRTLALAKLGRGDEARASVAEYIKMDVDRSFKPYVEIQVSALLGEIETAMQQLDKGIEDFSTDVGGLYNMARAAARCVQATVNSSPTASKKFADQAFEIFVRLRKLKYERFDQLTQDPDFAIFHHNQRFIELLAKWKTLEEYWVANCEVTHGQFEELINDVEVAVLDKPEGVGESLWEGGFNSIGPTTDYPAGNVNWIDAVKYCNWLSHKEGRSPCYRRTGAKVKLYGSSGEEHDEWEDIAGENSYRLLREAEWEFACRAGTTSDFASGNDETLLVKYCQMDSPKFASIAGSKLPNAWGLHDMHGNVEEWCNTKSGEFNEIDRVSRGGFNGNRASACRSEFGRKQNPFFRMTFRGFRLALSPSSEPGVRLEKPSGEGKE